MPYPVSRRQLLAALPALALAASARSQSAPAFPTRPVTLVVPFAAGGGTDLVARVLGQYMESHLGQPVVVDNRVGANGNLAGAYVAKATADGHTVLFNTSSMVISPSVYKKLGYDPLQDLAPVGLASEIPTGLIVSPQLPARSLAEFIAYAKANPGKLSYGSSGAGNINHMTAAQLVLAQGIDAVHVPYRGSAPATVDLAANNIQFMTDTVSNITGFVREGRLRLLAVATRQRLATYPDVPTFREAGVSGFESGAWNGMMVPTGTPAVAIERLNQVLVAGLKAPEVLRKLEEQGTQPLGSTPDEYGRFLRTEMERWSRVAREARLEMQ